MQDECSDIFERLESWSRLDGGAQVVAATERAVSEMLDRAFGYHILQLGLRGERPLCNNSPINHRIVCAQTAADGVDLLAHGAELPLESDSVDAVIAHHCLEFTDDPHQVLREIQRVLTPQGQLLLIGFNPYSLHGLNAYVRGLLGNPLWREHQPVGERRMMDWLRLLGCDVQEVVRIHAVPARGRGRLREGLVHMDRFCCSHNMPLGGVFILHATKQVAGINRPRRGVRRNRLIGLVPKPVAAPSPIPQRCETFEKEGVAA